MVLRILALLLLPIVVPLAWADDAPQVTHVRLTWEQRFVTANTAHDGHLTLEEAKTGYLTVARHFQEIDTEGKGYVTENDVRAWHATQKGTKLTKDLPEDPLRPRPAFRLLPADQHSAATSDAHTMMTVPTER